MALRLGLFNTAASLSGAFGGLLARGLTEIGRVGGQAQWTWIFTIEGPLGPSSIENRALIFCRQSLLLSLRTSCCRIVSPPHHF